jgi:hypothetical protein
MTIVQRCAQEMVAMVSEMAPGAGKFETPPGMQFVSAASTELSSVDNFDTGHLLEYEGASPLHGGALDAEYATNYLFSLDDTEGVGDVCSNRITHIYCVRLLFPLDDWFPVAQPRCPGRQGNGANTAATEIGYVSSA